MRVLRIELAMAPTPRRCCGLSWLLAELFNLTLLISIAGCIWWRWPLVGKLLMPIVAACRIFGTHRVLRLPVGTLLCSLLALDLLMYAVVRALTWLVEVTRRRRRRERALDQATTLSRALARGRHQPRRLRRARPVVRGGRVRPVRLEPRRFLHAAPARGAGGRRPAAADGGAAAVPQARRARRARGPGKGQVCHSTRAGTKQIIEGFVDEMGASLGWLARLRGRSLTAELEAERVSFLRAARPRRRCTDRTTCASLGSPALLLSGGAILSVYQFGMASALLELGMLPRLVSGSSGGAVVGAVARRFPDGELLAVQLREAAESAGTSEPYRELGPHGPLHGTRLWEVRQLLRRGRLYDWGHFHAHVQWSSKGRTPLSRSGRRTGAPGAPSTSRARRCARAASATRR